MFGKQVTQMDQVFFHKKLVLLESSPIMGLQSLFTFSKRDDQIRFSGRGVLPQFGLKGHECGLVSQLIQFICYVLYMRWPDVISIVKIHIQKSRYNLLNFLYKFLYYLYKIKWFNKKNCDHKFFIDHHLSY